MPDSVSAPLSPSLVLSRCTMTSRCRCHRPGRSRVSSRAHSIARRKRFSVRSENLDSAETGESVLPTEAYSLRKYSCCSGYSAQAGVPQACRSRPSR